MSKTVLIGFEIKNGKFTNEKTGELVEYNNRVLRFITDSGQTSDNIGFAQFEVKLKMEDVARSFGIGLNDQYVNETLSKNLHKEFEVLWAPKNGTMTAVGFRLVKAS
jgi:predicted metal-dependent TIM-barrel fold hydrolase